MPVALRTPQLFLVVDLPLDAADLRLREGALSQLVGVPLRVVGITWQELLRLFVGDGLDFVADLRFKLFVHFVLVELRYQIICRRNCCLLLRHLVNVAMFFPVDFFVEILNFDCLLYDVAFLVPDVQHVREVDLPDRVVEQRVQNDHTDQHAVAR